MRLCRYRYGSDRCAHRQVEGRECQGERNCLERSAPSYHVRTSGGPSHWFGLYSPEHRRFHPRTGERPANGGA